jgi:hypothetical protein
MKEKKSLLEKLYRPSSTIRNCRLCKKESPHHFNREGSVTDLMPATHTHARVSLLELFSRDFEIFRSAHLDPSRCS